MGKDLLSARKASQKNLGTKKKNLHADEEEDGDHDAGASSYEGAAASSAAGSKGSTEKDNFSVFAANVTEDLHPHLLLSLFRQMPPKDCLLVDVKDPEALFLTAQPVPPGTIRPTVTMGSTTNDDDLTHQVGKIWHGDYQLRCDMQQGSAAIHVIDLWRDIQTEGARMINSAVSGLPAETKLGQGSSKKAIRSICTRLKGKEGRFRCNLMGKRVDFSGRTVISPDPNVEIGKYQIFKVILRRASGDHDND